MVRAERHWLGGRRVKVNKPVARFLEAVGDRPAFQPPLAEEGTAALLHLFRRRGVDHVGVVGGNLLVQLVRGVSKQVPVLVGVVERDRWMSMTIGGPAPRMKRRYGFNKGVG